MGWGDSPLFFNIISNDSIMREKLINALINLASDELDEDTLIAMAKESEEQLVDRLIAIAHYYFMEY
jgi:hypothetical protein